MSFNPVEFSFSFAQYVHEHGHSSESKSSLRKAVMEWIVALPPVALGQTV